MSEFIESIQMWINNLSVNSIIIFIMMIFMLIGAVDRIQGNRWGYGQQFEEGFHAIGPMMLAMAGVIAAAPVLAIVLKPIVVPIYQLIGADASMFAGTLLASDTGGYPLAMELAGNNAVGNFSGLLVANMLGATLVFTLPVGMSLMKEKDYPYLGACLGRAFCVKFRNTPFLAGIITIPIGCLVGGIVMNFTSYKMSLLSIIRNMLPVILMAALIVIGLWNWPEKMLKGFQKFGTGLKILITIFIAIAVFEYQTGIHFPLFRVMVEEDSNGTIPLENSFLICGQIGTILIGAFPMVKWMTKTFGSILSKVGKTFGMNEVGSAGLIATLANNIAMFNMIGDMNEKSKIINIAFAVSASFTFGDHLAFTAGVNPKMIVPVIVGKLTAGCTAFLLASALTSKLLVKIQIKK